MACDSAGARASSCAPSSCRLGHFSSADDAFARDEGEDDLSLSSWQAEHRKYWTRVRARRGLEWTEADQIVFGRFRVVWPPEPADPA
jgi:uncharacterized protein YhfF